MERHLQNATAVAFLVLCVVGTAVGVKALLAPAPPVGRTGAATGPRTAPPSPPTYAVGERINLSGVDFGASDQTLLLVVRKGCRFCDESMPFYKQLGDDAAIAKRTRLVIAAPDDETVSREELAKQAVRVDQVVKVSAGQLKIRGTPTAILVDRSGAVRQVFIGRLDEAKQQELVGVLKASARP
jgi:hypothetical protein